MAACHNDDDDDDVVVVVAVVVVFFRGHCTRETLVACSCSSDVREEMAPASR
jgi:hypothetical protein